MGDREGTGAGRARVAAARSSEGGAACPVRPAAMRVYFQRHPGDRGSARDRAMGRLAVHVSGGCYGDEGEDGRTTADTSIDVYATDLVTLELLEVQLVLDSYSPEYEPLESESDRVALKQRLEALGYLDKEGDISVWDEGPGVDEAFEDAILAFKADHGLLSGPVSSSHVDAPTISAINQAFSGMLPR